MSKRLEDMELEAFLSGNESVLMLDGHNAGYLEELDWLRDAGVPKSAFAAELVKRWNAYRGLIAFKVANRPTITEEDARKMDCPYPDGSDL